MSGFFDNLSQCMQGSGFPVPSVEDANEALEFAHKLHSAWENAGGEVEMTIGALIALGAATGIDEAVLEVLAVAAEVTVLAYFAAIIACLASLAIDEIKGLFASNDLPQSIVDELNRQGVDISSGDAVA